MGWIMNSPKGVTAGIPEEWAFLAPHVAPVTIHFYWKPVICDCMTIIECHKKSWNIFGLAMDGNYIIQLNNVACRISYWCDMYYVTVTIISIEIISSVCDVNLLKITLCILHMCDLFVVRFLLATIIPTRFCQNDKHLCSV